MPPNIKTEELTYEVNEDDDEGYHEKPSTAAPWQPEYLLPNIIFFTYCYIAGIYGVYLCFTSAKWGTIVFTIFSFIAATLGITAGAHRLWAHKCYKARRPLQIFLMLCHCLAYQRTLVTWVRDHRLHHKYSDTDADPHNASRGLFYSHIGWLLVKNHPEVVKRRETVDMSDVYSNPVLMFQKRHARWLLPIIGIVLPSAIPWLLGETFSISWHLNMFRYMVNSNLTFLTNSISHRWGYRPYDGSMKACQSIPILLMTMGEGFHNYHHAFPWDYRASELGSMRINYITRAIDFFEKIGWAYDLKTASERLIQDRATRTGDGTDLWGRKLEKDLKKDS